MNQIPLRSQLLNVGHPNLSLAPTIGNVSGSIGQQQLQQPPSSLGSAQRYGLQQQGGLGLSQISWEGRGILLPQSQLAPMSLGQPIRRNQLGEQNQGADSTRQQEE